MNFCCKIINLVLLLVIDSFSELPVRQLEAVCIQGRKVGITRAEHYLRVKSFNEGAKHREFQKGHYIELI